MPYLTAEQVKAVIREKIPKGLVVAAHTDRGHFYRYTPTSETYSSVTTKSGILEAQHLKKWAANQAVLLIESNMNLLCELHSLQEKETDPAKLQGLGKRINDIYKAAVMSHQDQFHEAGGVGTAGHNVVERYLKDWILSGNRPGDITKYIELPDSRLHAISRSAEKFCSDYDVQPIASEIFVASQRYKFAGQLDAIMLIPRITREGKPGCKHKWMLSPKNNGTESCFECNAKRVFELTLVDWKTSNTVNKPEYAMQVAAYWWGFYELTGIRMKSIMIVKLSKDKMDYEVVKLVNRSKAFRAFVHTGHTYSWLSNNEDKLISLKKKESISLDAF